MEDHKKLYEEALVKEIMISTALCVQEMIQEDSHLSEEDLCQFLEDKYQNIIEETLAESDEESPEGWEEEP